MQRILVMSGLLLAMSGLTAAEATLKTVKYPDLTSIVRDNKGKVVLVDFWRHD